MDYERDTVFMHCATFVKTWDTQDKYPLVMDEWRVICKFPGSKTFHHSAADTRILEFISKE